MANKIFKTLDEQIDILKSRGLIVNDYDKAKKILFKENYFFLNGYRHFFTANYKDENLIALAGVYQPSNDKEKTKIPLAVDSFLKKNRYIKRIFLHLDNDDAGRRATEYLKNILKTNYEVIDGKPFYGKDWNDFLKELINQNSKKKEKNTIESR